MEALSQSLQPYKSLIGSVTSVLTIAQFFSGSIICKDIYHKKSTSGISAMPFIGGLVIGILMLKYSQMLQDWAMLSVNLAAVALNLLYTAFYYVYSQDKSSEVHKPLTYGFTLIAVLLGYTNWEDPDLVEYRFGFICTILMLLLMGAPLIELNEIIAKKDASSIPFPITSSSFVVIFLWLIYGIILLNDFMIIQNLLGLILCAAQLVLYWMYPAKPSAVKQD